MSVTYLKKPRLQFFLNILLIFVTLVACHIDSFYLFIRKQSKGERIFITVRSDRTFQFDRAKALGAERRMAISHNVPIYTFIPDTLDSIEKKMHRLLRKIDSDKRRRRKEIKDFQAFMSDEFYVNITYSQADRILRYRNIEKLINGIMTVQESILQKMIVEDDSYLKRKKTIEIHYPPPTGPVKHFAETVMTLAEVREQMKNKVWRLFWQVNNSVLSPLVECAAFSIKPNIVYDQEKNRSRIENIIRRYPSNTVQYKVNDILVPFRKVLTREDEILLREFKNQVLMDFFSDFPKILTIILFSIIFFNFVVTGIIQRELRKRQPVILLLTILILSIVISKGILLISVFPVHVIPFCILPLTLVLLNHRKVTVFWTTFTGAILVTLFCGRDIETFFFFLFGGFISLTFSKIRKRTHVMGPSIVVGFCNVVILSLFSIHPEAISRFMQDMPGYSTFLDLFHSTTVYNMEFAFFGGIAAGPISLVLLLFLELSWHNASTFKLNRFMDLQHPLMKDLLTKSPGTYQHSMTVAYLAQSVGEAIGVDTELLNIGAFYHDIGKTVHPNFFIENQCGGKNPHNELDPKKSTEIILNHVNNGVRIGQEAGLPKIVIDLMLQHHGTMLVEYFFNKAAKNGDPAGDSEKNGESLKKEDFRYSGPKPRSIEAAILMIVDAVEAASRTLKEPTRKNINTMIRLIISKRISDRQFDECDLSTRDLAVIMKVLIDSLEASFHSRVEYPWQNEKKKQGVRPKTEDGRKGSGKAGQDAAS